MNEENEDIFSTTPESDDDLNGTDDKVEKDETSGINDMPGIDGTGVQNPLAGMFEWLELFVFSFTFVMLIITLVGRHSPVQGTSMINTLHHNDVLIVSDLLYKPKQGDVIVFQSPNTGYDEPYVKRIIATGGQTLDIDFANWEVTVDGVKLDESYVFREPGRPMDGSSFTFPLTVPEGHIFVMGDNRNASSDSRLAKVGMVDNRFIIGRVIFRIFPLNAIGTVK